MDRNLWGVLKDPPGLNRVKAILNCPCCSSQLTVFIKVHLIFIWSITEKNAHFTHTSFFALQKFTSEASHDPNSTLNTWAKQSLLHLEYFIF